MHSVMRPSIPTALQSARTWRPLLVLCGSVLLSSCADLIAPRIVAPQRVSADAALKTSAGGQLLLDDVDAYISKDLHVAVGPPQATLALAVVPPGHYFLRFGAKNPGGCRVIYISGPAQTQLIRETGHLWLANWAVEHHMTESAAKKKAQGNPGIHFSPTVPPQILLREYRTGIAKLRSTSPARGTIILLPGDGNGMLSMMPWALILGSAGYRSILVDLRAQGQSTGAHITYGALESRDLIQLVTALRKRGLIQGRLGLLGDSLGAATALLAAPNLSGLSGIVAISPYARATTVIPRFARHLYWYARLIPESSWRAAERKACRIAGANLAEAAPITVVSRIRVPVLYLQGGEDRIVGLPQARELAMRTVGSTLIIYPKLGHIKMAIAYTQLARPVIEWLNRHIAQDPEAARLRHVRQRPRNSFSLSFCAQ